MRTTLEIDDDILQAVKDLAANRGDAVEGAGGLLEEPAGPLGAGLEGTEALVFRRRRGVGRDPALPAHQLVWRAA